MADRSDRLEDYELFFQEIGSGTSKASILNEEAPEQKDDEETPSLSEDQVSQLTKDLQEPMDHPEEDLRSKG